jgi:hypothetical protein
MAVGRVSQACKDGRLPANAPAAAAACSGSSAAPPTPPASAWQAPDASADATPAAAQCTHATERHTSCAVEAFGGESGGGESGGGVAGAPTAASACAPSAAELAATVPVYGAAAAAAVLADASALETPRVDESRLSVS